MKTKIKISKIKEMKKDITLLEQLESSYKEQIEKLEEREKELKKKRIVPIGLEFSPSLLQSDYQARIIQAYQMLIELQTLKLKHQ
jgi:hypothetical protein